MIIGSSNIGKSALTTGVEGNVGVERGQSVEAAGIVDQFCQRPGLISVNEENFECIQFTLLEKANQCDQLMESTGYKGQWTNLQKRISELDKEVTDLKNNARLQIVELSKNPSTTMAQPSTRRRRIVPPPLETAVNGRRDQTTKLQLT